jgi:hypothetical protein
MSYKITSSDEGDYIAIHVQGEMDRNFSLQLAKEAQAQGYQYNTNKFLVDVIHAVNVDSALGQYQFANEDLLALAEMDHYARIAILVAPDDHSHDFVETVVRNVGINFKLFRDRQSALAFLLDKDVEESQTG